MWTPINRDWTVKPPLGTPLRTDGHWSVQGLVGCWLFNEGGGIKANNFVIQGDTPFWEKGGLHLRFYSGSYSYIPLPLLLQGSSEFTICLKQKMDVPSGARCLYSGTANGYRQNTIEILGSDIFWETRDTSTGIDGSRSTKGIVKILFYVNGGLKTSDTVSPYGFNWNTVGVANGYNIVMARTYYDDGSTLEQRAYANVRNNDQVGQQTLTVCSDTKAVDVYGSVAVSALAPTKTVGDNDLVGTNLAVSNNNLVFRYSKSKGVKEIYCNGRLVVSTSVSVDSLNGSWTDENLFYDSVYSENYGGVCDYFYIYNRALSPQECTSISTNPYQVCQP